MVFYRESIQFFLTSVCLLIEWFFVILPQRILPSSWVDPYTSDLKVKIETVIDRNTG